MARRIFQMTSSFRMMFSFFLIVFLCTFSQARNTNFNYNINYGSQVLVLKNEAIFYNDVDFQPTSIQSTKVENLSLEETKKLIARLADSKKNVETTMVTDISEIANEVKLVESLAETKQKKKYDFLIYLDNLKTKVSETYKQDKFGFWITLVTFGVDSYLWITASKMSTLSKVGMISFNFLLTASFGVNKDLWAKTTRPIQSKIYTLLSWMKQAKEQNSVAVKYASSLILGSAIQFTRLAIFHGSELMAASTAPWLIGSTLAISSILAFSQFGWDEHIAAVDKNKSPTAKFAIRRFHELRGLLMTYLSSTSKLAQSDMYGITPWVYSVVNGIAGIAAYLNTDKVVNFIEKINKWWPGLTQESRSQLCFGSYN